MVGREIVAICHFSGEFVSESDGSLSYTGGEAHAMDIDQCMLFDDLKSELTSTFNIDINTMSIKYFLPNNRRTLITISSDKDLQRMVDFHADSLMTELYIMDKVNKRVAAELGSATLSSGQNNRSNGQPTFDKNINWATRSRMNVADGTPKFTAGDPAENGEQQIIATTTIDKSVVAAPPITAIFATPAEDITQQRLMEVGEFGNREIESIASDSTLKIIENATPVKPSSLWADAITGIGQEFDTVKDFRDALLKYSIGKGFSYKFLKNDHDRVTAKCTAENCPWRIHGSRSIRKKKFVIKKLHDVHLCGGDTGKDRRTTKHWLASIIKEKLRDTPNYKPKDIASDLLREYGIRLNYSQAWRGREVAQKELYNLHEEACNQLPWFCERILETNPGSVAMLASSVDTKFRRVFVSFHASLQGFERGCRPLLFLDRIPLKANNQWKLLAAVSVDGDDGVFPVAFAAVEAESYDSWLWFLIQLKFAVTTTRAITFVSNGQKGLEEAVPQVFEDSFHSYCLRQLIEDFKVELKKGSWSEQTKDAMIDDFRHAANACLPEDFKARIENIRSISTDAAEWVMASNPEHWSNAYFMGSRYDHLSSNILGSLNSWIPVKQESSVVLMVEAIRVKMAEMINSRREKSDTWEGTITPTLEQKLQKEIPKSHMLSVICSSDTVFEVRGNTVDVVNIQSRECTCRRWQITGLPCIHAIAVLDRLGKGYYDYCSRYFIIETYRFTYSESINPIPDIGHVSSIFGANLYPPSNRPPGRPKRKRIDPNKTVIRPLHCSRCNIAGHNRATCQAPL